MPKYEIITIADATVRERWFVEAATAEEAEEAVYNGGPNVEFIDQTSDNETNRETEAVRLITESVPA